MKFGNLYCILTFFSFFIFSGTAGAHPHELGKMNHGPSLESYQVQLDFTIGGSANRQHDQNITIAKKGKLQTTIKNDKNLTDKKLEKLKKVKEDNFQKQNKQ